MGQAKTYWGTDMGFPNNRPKTQSLNILRCVGLIIERGRSDSPLV